MNQKGFVNLIVIGIVLAVVLGYFVLVRKPATPSEIQQPIPPLGGTTVTPTPPPDNSKSIPPSTTTSGEKTRVLTGIAAESRKRFIDAGLMGEYFDVHFKLNNTTSGTDSRGRYTYIYWTYTVGEYKTEVVDSIKHDRPDSITTTLHDITSVIPFQRALDTLSSCIGKGLSQKETSIEYDYRSGLTGEKGGGLYLAGSSSNGQEGFVVITQTKVNLESSKCDPVSQNKIYN